MPGNAYSCGLRTRARRLFAAACVAGLLGACAPRLEEPLNGLAVAPTELTEVPFVAQEQYQCGPAALAMALQWSGSTVSANDLVSQVYLPERKGSLQAEMIAAARRAGRVAYRLRPSLRSLIAEVAAGHPVIVLQNLGLEWSPRWHYAVVVGFDLDRQELVLRSGLQRRHILPLPLFERTWQRGERWALVALPPGRLPATAEENVYIGAVAALERLALWPEAQQAYAAGLLRWPRSLAARIGLGNALVALGDLDGAEAVLRQASIDHANAGVAFNNLAEVLARQGRFGEALEAAEHAVRLGGPLSAAFAETRERLQRLDAARQPLGPPHVESDSSELSQIRPVKLP